MRLQRIGPDMLHTQRVIYIYLWILELGEAKSLGAKEMHRGRATENQL